MPPGRADESPDAQRRRILLRVVLASGALAACFVAYNLAVGHLDRALVSVSALATSALAGALLRFTRSYRPPLVVVMLYAAGMTLGLLASARFPPGDLVWCFLVPPLISYAGGLAVARWLLPLYVLAVAAIVLSSGFPHRETWWALELPPRFLGLLTLVSAMAYLYEATRAQAQDELARTNRRLADAADDSRRLAQKAQAASEAKSRFLSQMSHDIRTPLTGVLGMSELLETTDLDDRQREYLRTIRTSGEALSELIGGILDLARIESGRVELNLSSLPLRPFLEEVRTIVDPLAAAKGLRLVTEVDAGLPGCVQGDPAHLRQILLNLAGNAVKFTDRGEVRIRFAPAPDGDPRRWCIEVSDTGIGIPRDQHRRIFESFAQGDPGTAPRRPGFGLGLAICARLVDLMGGGMTLDSEVGKGSTFRVELPLVTSEEPRQDLLDRATGAQAPGPLRVLVVDDSETVRRVLASLLIRAGHAPLEAPDGPAGLALLATHPIDVVLMDVQMPGLDGIEAVRRLRQAGLPGAGVPVVALTALADPRTRQDCLDAGMSEVVTKPVDPASLAAALALAVQGDGGTGRS